MWAWWMRAGKGGPPDRLRWRVHKRLENHATGGKESFLFKLKFHLLNSLNASSLVSFTQLVISANYCNSFQSWTLHRFGAINRNVRDLNFSGVVSKKMFQSSVTLSKLRLDVVVRQHFAIWAQGGPSGRHLAWHHLHTSIDEIHHQGGTHSLVPRIPTRKSWLDLIWRKKERESSRMRREGVEVINLSVGPLDVFGLCVRASSSRLKVPSPVNSSTAFPCVLFSGQT